MGLYRSFRRTTKPSDFFVKASTTVIDIVTKPSTPLLVEAANRGCRNVGGAAMVTAQTKAILKFFGVDVA